MLRACHLGLSKVASVLRLHGPLGTLVMWMSVWDDTMSLADSPVILQSSFSSYSGSMRWVSEWDDRYIVTGWLTSNSAEQFNVILKDAPPEVNAMNLQLSVIPSDYFPYFESVQLSKIVWLRLQWVGAVAPNPVGFGAYLEPGSGDSCHCNAPSKRPWVQRPSHSGTHLPAYLILTTYLKLHKGPGGLKRGWAQSFEPINRNSCTSIIPIVICKQTYRKL